MPAVVRLDTECACVQIDAEKLSEIFVRESKGDCLALRFERVAVDPATAPIPEQRVRALATSRLHPERVSRYTSSDCTSSNQCGHDIPPASLR